MKITMYELLGLVKDGKQPKTIKYSSCIMIYDVDENDYRTPEKDYYDADVKTYKYLHLTLMCIHLKLALLSYYQEYVLLLPEYLYHLCIPKYHLYMYYTNRVNHIS